uniref:Uncharacterized protein n=1 Tax=Arundo donax TaxID=35708 RepID=A0A0A9GLL9_ARUDO
MCKSSIHHRSTTNAGVLAVESSFHHHGLPFAFPANSSIPSPSLL